MSAGQKIFPHFAEPGSSLSYSQGPPTFAIQRQMNLIHTRPFSLIKAILILHRSCEMSASDVSIKTFLSPFSQARHVTCTLGAFGNCGKRLLAASYLRFCPAACNNSVPKRRIFMKFHTWIFLEYLSKRFKFHWNPTSITGTLHEEFWSYLVQFLEWEMFQTDIVRKIETHILCLITYFRKSCRLWDNVEEYGTARQATKQPDRPQMTIWRMRIACWMPEVTNTHLEYVMCIFHGNSGCMVAPRCWVIRALRFLLSLLC